MSQNEPLTFKELHTRLLQLVTRAVVGLDHCLNPGHGRIDGSEMFDENEMEYPVASWIRWLRTQWEYTLHRSVTDGADLGAD